MSLCIEYYREGTYLDIHTILYFFYFTLYFYTLQSHHLCEVKGVSICSIVGNKTSCFSHERCTKVYQKYTKKRRCANICLRIRSVEKKDASDSPKSRFFDWNMKDYHSEVVRERIRKENKLEIVALEIKCDIIAVISLYLLHFWETVP